MPRVDRIITVKTNLNDVNCIDKYLEKVEECTETLQQAIVSTSWNMDGQAMGMSRRLETQLNELNDRLKNSSLDTSEAYHSMQKAATLIQVRSKEVSEKWDWLRRLMKCARKHLKNAGKFHQFFFDLKEITVAVNINVTFLLNKISDDLSDTTLTADDLKLFANHVKELYESLDFWQSKLSHLQFRASTLAPLDRRTDRVEKPFWVVSMTHYSPPESETRIEAKQDLLLLDNTDPQEWRVEDLSGVAHDVPAAIIFVPPPCNLALESIAQLRLQLTTLWTRAVKKLAKRMFWLLIVLIKNWSSGEEDYICSLSKDQHEALHRFLKEFEDLYRSHWSTHPGFSLALEKINKLRHLLRNSTRSSTDVTESHSSVLVVDELRTLMDIVSNLKDLNQTWSYNTIANDVTQSKEQLLVADSLSKLQVVEKEDIVKVWSAQMELEIAERSETWEDPYNVAVTTEVASKTRESAEVHQDFREQTSSFGITGVYDASTDDFVSMKRAIECGIIDKHRGLYINRRKGESVSLDTAITNGLILVDSVKRETTREESKNYGLITIDVQMDSRPYKLLEVWQAGNERWIGPREAIQAGLVDEHKGRYVMDLDQGAGISLTEAEQLGFVKMQFEEGKEKGSSDVVSRTYAVTFVIDQQKKERVSYDEAVEKGLLVAPTGMYINNLTGEELEPAEAIRKGFLKVKLITDPRKIDVEPEKSASAIRMAKLRNTVKAMGHLAASKK